MRFINTLLFLLLLNATAIGQAMFASYQGASYLPNFITAGMRVRYEVTNTSSYSGTGNTITDLMGNANGTLFNSPVYTNSAGTFLNMTSASSNYILTNNLGSTYNQSVFMWVYPTGNGVILAELGQAAINSGYHYSLMEVNGSSIRFSMWPYTINANSGFVSSSITLNTWNYVGFTYNGTTLTAYVNGVSVASYAITRQAPANLYYGIGATESTNTFTSGGGGYGNFRFGAFHYYNRPLSANEVLLNFNSSKSRYPSQKPFLSLKTIANYLANYRNEFKNPSFYNYTLDGSSFFINDGGGDMYDNGNITSPWLISGTTYRTSAGYSSVVYPFAIDYSISSNTSNAVDGDFYYISMGYGNNTTTFHPLTVLGSRSNTGSPVGFQVGGNSGADGGGLLASGMIVNGAVYNGFTVYAFYRQTYSAGDPSHCNLFILLGHPNWGSVFGTITSFADPVSNGGNGGSLFTSGANTSNILAIQTLLSKSGGVQVTSAECLTVVQNYTLRIQQALGF